MEDLRYPIGRLVRRENLTPEERRAAIATIAATPGNLRAAVAGLNDAQLDTPYRPDGWTVRQVVHHLPDSHMNAYVRFKLALTEDEPAVRPYLEDRWARLPEASLGPIEMSLALLEALHERWGKVLSAMTPAEWERTYRHPEAGVQKVDALLVIYAWHGPHHVAHITSLRQRQGW
jgi:hypothetical protein